MSVFDYKLYICSNFFKKIRDSGNERQDSIKGAAKNQKRLEEEKEIV
jgi:hypothetical protein